MKDSWVSPTYDNNTKKHVVIKRLHLLNFPVCLAVTSGVRTTSSKVSVPGSWFDFQVVNQVQPCFSCRQRTHSDEASCLLENLSVQKTVKGLNLDVGEQQNYRTTGLWSSNDCDDTGVSRSSPQTVGANRKVVWIEKCRGCLESFTEPSFVIRGIFQRSVQSHRYDARACDEATDLFESQRPTEDCFSETSAHLQIDRCVGDDRRLTRLFQEIPASLHWQTEVQRTTSSHLCCIVTHQVRYTFVRQSQHKTERQEDFRTNVLLLNTDDLILKPNP